MKVTLGEVAEITKLAGFEFTKYMKYVDEGEIIAIRALNLKNGKLVLDDVKKISKDVSMALPRSQLRKDDIVISYTGTIGEYAQITEDEKYHLAPNVAKITPKECINHDYLFQYIRSSTFRKTMISYCHGSTQSTIPMKIIRELPIEVPPRKTQDKIAAIIQSIDNKISINNRIDKNLCAQMTTLFNNACFVNLSQHPNNCKKGNLFDIASYLNGLAMQKFRPQGDETGLPVLKIKELRQGFCDSDSELCSPNIKSEYIVHDGDIIFSWSGSLLVDIWCGGTCGLNQHLFKVTSDTYDKWFYYLWTVHHLNNFIAIAADKATTMGHIKREDLAKAEVLIPSEEDYKKISAVMNPIFELITANRIEARKLAELRDELLPKLMSGEIDVSNLQM